MVNVPAPIAPSEYGELSRRRPLEAAVPTTGKAETAVLIDGLERENQLLRKQLDRHFSREKQLRAEAEVLRAKAEEAQLRGARQVEATHESVLHEGARLRAEAER